MGSVIPKIPLPLPRPLPRLLLPPSSGMDPKTRPSISPEIRDPTVHQATVDKGSEAGSIGDGTTTPSF